MDVLVVAEPGLVGIGAASGGPGFGRLARSKEQRLRDWRTYQCRAYAFGWQGDCFAQPSRLDAQAAEMRAQAESKVSEEKELAQGRERIAARCEAERAKAPVYWRPIGLDIFQSGAHEKRAPGMIYGLEFPWSEELLVEFGPSWLTKAFHAAGTMDKDNRVTAVIPEPKIKVTAGNNAGKFLFEVRYAKKTADLHTKLFAKIPFPLQGFTASDRQSSSVYKQPMDLFEINTYRLLESSLPVKSPKYYFGDISNETSNFILIVERVDFTEINGKRKGDLAPFEVEGPYEKCKDWMLRGPEKDYYMLLVNVHAKVAGAHKLGKFGPDSSLMGCLRIASTSPNEYGMNPSGPTGEDPKMVMNKLNAAVKFFAETAKVVFPSYVTSDAFQKKFRLTMLKLSAYNQEIEYWKHHNPDYIAFGHQNLNMDNAYFWRDAEGKLDCGIFDFGGFGSSSLPHRIWWGLNCAEFDQIKGNLTEYIDGFSAMYSDFGGPRLDKEVMRTAIIITALQNMMFMVAAVPNCLTMCPVKEWETIRDRHDPRISSDVGGKSTLRTTLQVMNNGLRMLEEMQADQVLDRWVREVYVGQFGKTAKSEAMINGS